MTITSKIYALWRLGWPIWVSLGFGFIIVFISCLVKTRFEASGAVLVCSAIVSELIYSRSMWRSRSTSTVALEKASPVEGIFQSLNKSEELWALSRNSDIYPNGWRISDTANRLGLYMAIIIAFAAVFGTLIWGYGDIVKVCQCK